VKKLQIELFGTARRLAQTKELELEVAESATFRDVIAALARQIPAFLGHIITPDARNLVEPYFFNVDARKVVRDLDGTPEEGKPLLLLFVDAGG
jgi:molybdopterin converting factor small subunit